MHDHFVAEVKQASAYCTYCPKLCRFNCPVAEAECRETVTPWGLMRLLEFSRTGDFELDAHAAKTFYHCTGCMRCQTWCRHKNDVPQAMWAARAWSVDKGLLPESLSEIEPSFAVCGASAPMPKISVSLIDTIFDPTSSIAFFPDCHTRREQPQLVLKIGKLLASLLGSKVRLLTHVQGTGAGCCGFELKAAGLTDAYDEHTEALTAELSGVKKIISDCAPFVAMQRSPARFGLTDDDADRWPKLEHLIETLSTSVIQQPPQAKLESGGVMLHDSCFVGRHLSLYDATRTVAAALFETPPQDFDLDRDQATCCGAANLYDKINPEGSKACGDALLAQMKLEGGQAILCGQANCKKLLSKAQDDVAIDVLEAAILAYEITL